MTWTRNILEVGQKVREVLVLAQADTFDRHGHLRRRVQVRYLCGHEGLIWNAALVSRRSSNCPMCDRRLGQIVKVGDVFDQLTVVNMEIIPTPPNRKVAQSPTWFVCRCSCGGVTKKIGQTLLKNQTNHCGCRRRLSWKGVGHLSGTVYCRIASSAKKRKIPFEISIEQLWGVLERQQFRCALSGLPIELDKDSDFLKTTASVDRIDSNKGYTVENVQWVHKDVNLMKNALPQGRFLDLCVAISRHACSK